eukprot:m.1346679 g.1346679  ORF g.1346679 m.1346679 type:complete len:91 (+) comp24907_c0_seq3:2581-2853(+)
MTNSNVCWTVQRGIGVISVDGTSCHSLQCHPQAQPQNPNENAVPGVTAVLVFVADGGTIRMRSQSVVLGVVDDVSRADTPECIDPNACAS